MNMNCQCSTVQPVHLVDPLLDLGEVGEDQLQPDDLHVPQRVHGAVHVDDVVVLEAPHHVHDRVRLTDVRQELVAQSLALRCSLDYPRYIDKLHLNKTFGKLSASMSAVWGVRTANTTIDMQSMYYHGLYAQ